ncbi:hypothetical protein D3C78_1237320 [compost metagenome]
MNAGEDARGQHGGREARAFLIGPVGDDDRVFGLDVQIVQAAHHFQPGQHAEHAIELAAGRLGVEMAADIDRQSLRVLTGARGEHGSHAVDAHRQARRLAPALEQAAAFRILIRQRAAIIAAGDAGADFRHVHQTVPQTVAIDRQVFTRRHAVSSSPVLFLSKQSLCRSLFCRLR